MKDCPKFGGCGSKDTLKPTGRGKEGWDLWKCERCGEYSWVEKDKVETDMANNTSITRLNLLHNGANPQGIMADAEITGDAGIYNEIRMSAYDKEGNCIGDVLMGLDEKGELRVLLTTGGDGDGDHSVAIYPTRNIEHDALELMD